MRAPIRKLPDVEILRSLLDYNPETGALLWRPRQALSRPDKCFNTKYAGKPAGSISGDAGRSNQYLVVGIRVDGVFHQYKAHRVIWKMMTGQEPPDFIDHEDGDPFNLKWINLREATNGQNIQNSKLRKDNSSGVKGVCWDAGHKKWLATIAVDKRYQKVGRFDTIEEATKAIDQARERLHGEFARRT